MVNIMVINHATTCTILVTTCPLKFTLCLLVNSLCHMLINIANSLDPDQDPKLFDTLMFSQGSHGTLWPAFVTAFHDTKLLGRWWYSMTKQIAKYITLGSIFCSL